MKILICIPTLLVGGTEIQTLNLVKSLVQDGHKVTTVCYFEHDEMMLDYYRESGSEVILLNPAGHRIGGWRCLASLYLGLRKVVKNICPDVVHVQYMAPGAIPILLLKLIGVNNILATLHTSADIYKSLKLIHFLQKYFVRAFTCITRRAEESFFGTSCLYSENYKLKKHNHFTIYNALPSYISIRETSKIFADTLTIGVVSRLEEIKGMDLVIPAFIDLKKKYKNIRLLIVGDGSLKSEMERIAKSGKLSENINWAGRQNQDKLQGYYDQIDILCVPSRSEGFGLTVIEGMARGCVVVASNVGGLPEIVIDREVGLLHESENVNDMVASISTLIDDRNYLKQLSDNAILYAQHFEHRIYSQLFNNLYSKL